MKEKMGGRIPIYLIVIFPFPRRKQKLLLQEGCRAENKCVFVIIRISPRAKNHADPATKGFKFQNCHAYMELSLLYSLQFADSDKDFSPEQTTIRKCWCRGATAASNKPIWWCWKEK